MIRVFLVDDHELFLSGVRSELAKAFEVVGSANDVDEAIAQILDLRPDVILVDVHMPGGGGPWRSSNASLRRSPIQCFWHYRSPMRQKMSSP